MRIILFFRSLLKEHYGENYLILKGKQFGLFP